MTEKPLSSLRCLVTGASSGIGLWTKALLKSMLVVTQPRLLHRITKLRTVCHDATGELVSLSHVMRSPLNVCRPLNFLIIPSTVRLMRRTHRPGTIGVFAVDFGTSSQVSWSTRSCISLAAASSSSFLHGDAIASASVQEKIRQIIEKEDPRKPFSDDKISKILRNENINIARRTVSKYREIMKVLPSSKRKIF